MQFAQIGTHSLASGCRQTGSLAPGRGGADAGEVRTRESGSTLGGVPVFVEIPRFCSNGQNWLSRSHMRRGGLRTWEHDSSPQQSSKTAEPYGKPTPAPARPSSPACNPLLRGFIQVLLRRRGAPCDLLPSSCSCWGCGASGRSCSPGPDRAWSRHHTTHRRHDPQAHAAFATEPGELVERSIPGIRRSTSAPVAGADVEP